MKRVRNFAAAFLAAVSVMMACGAAVSADTYFNIVMSRLTSSSVTLTWDEQEYANAYRLYMYDRENDEWRRMKTVTDESCTFTGLKPSARYKLKIQAIHRYPDGTYSELDTSGAVTLTTKAAKSTSKKMPSFPKPEDCGFISADIDDALYGGVTTAFDEKECTEILNDYRSAFVKKGFTVSKRVRLEKIETDETFIMAYFVYYNDSIVGMTLEVIAYNGEDFGVCVAYTTDRTEIENVLPQLR